MQCPCAICHLRSARLYNSLTNYLKNGSNFEKKNIERKMYILITSTAFFLNMFYILKRTEQDMIKNVYWSLCKVP